MPHPENIIPPKKGEIRNPKGKPPGTKNRSTLLRKWLEAGTKVGTVEDEVILALIKKAKSGDIQAIKEIQDTLHGKIADKSEVKHEGDIIINLNKGAKL